METLGLGEFDDTLLYERMFSEDRSTNDYVDAAVDDLSV